MDRNNLNKLIAEALGVDHITLQEDAYEQFVNEDPYYGYGNWITFLDGDEVSGQRFPKDWQRDLNAAWPLFLELPPNRQLTYDRVKDLTYLEWRQDNEWRSTPIPDKSPAAFAQTICTAWLQWKGIEIS